MDTSQLFKTISRKMQADFDATAQVKHRGSRGAVRENILRNFLSEGRLPPKYGLGSGEVVGRIKETSRQSDVIIYDKLNGVILLYDEQTQVYPIDCVYGIVEVKSGLSKRELFDALDKIAAFKAMAPSGAVSQPLGGVLSLQYARPKPFGVVFAFSLSGNSLSSLSDNVREWEADKDPSLWPNYICVLGEGVISHWGPEVYDKPISSEDLKAGSRPISLSHGEESLFQFYCAVHDMCARMQLGPVELLRYYEPATRIGRFVVDGRINFTRASDGRSVQPSAAALSKIVEWCATRPQLKYGEILLKQFGALPVGMEGSKVLQRKYHLYNPDDLPGLHELGSEPIVRSETGVMTIRPSLASLHKLVIDGDDYLVAIASLGEADFEEAPTPA